jgi:hypothetical protein
MICCKGLRDGLHGAAPSEIVMHGGSSSNWDKPTLRAECMLSAPPTTKLGRMCRNMRNSGVAKVLLRLRVFLWDGLRKDAPELEALLRECGALETFELCMPSIVHRDDTFIEHAFNWTERLLAATPTGITKLQIPLVPGILRNGSSLERLTKLEHLTVTTSGLGGGTKEFPVIEIILSRLPRLRSLIVRSTGRNPMPRNIKLVSESLESLIIHNDKRASVASYNCPKLRTLQLSCYDLPEGNALESGTHAMDLTTIPAELKSTWHHHGFIDGMFVADDIHQGPRCSRDTYNEG